MLPDRRNCPKCGDQCRPIHAYANIRYPYNRFICWPCHLAFGYVRGQGHGEIKGTKDWKSKQVRELPETF